MIDLLESVFNLPLLIAYFLPLLPLFFLTALLYKAHANFCLLNTCYEMVKFLLDKHFEGDHCKVLDIDDLMLAIIHPGLE